MRPQLTTYRFFLRPCVLVSDFGPKSGSAHSCSWVSSSFPGHSVSPSVCPFEYVCSPFFLSGVVAGPCLLWEALPGASVPLQGVWAWDLGRPGAHRGGGGQAPLGSGQISLQACLGHRPQLPEAFVFPHLSALPCLLPISSNWGPVGPWPPEPTHLAQRARPAASVGVILLSRGPKSYMCCGVGWGGVGVPGIVWKSPGLLGVGGVSLLGWV